MISDDTEHAFMTAQALLEADGNVEKFRRSLAWKLRWWFAALPAGVGLATARACIRLWLGVDPQSSGVHSAGNGPAMRSAILGAVLSGDSAKRREFVQASSRLTHLDPRAETAALAVAEVAAAIVTGNDATGDFADRLGELSSDEEWLKICHLLTDHLAARKSVQDFAAALGPAGGVTGYAYHTVPVALYAWLRHRPDFSVAVTDAIRCGGDTDTVATIVGAFAGCAVGVEGIPAAWRNRLMDWPRSPRMLNRLATELAAARGRPVRWFWPAVIPRNLAFLAVVLVHGFRRLLPPY